MFPILYDKNTNAKLAILDNIISDSVSITRSINREFTFAFQAHEKEMKSEYFESEAYVAIGDKLFDLKYVETDHNISVLYNIDCEHVFYRLIENELDYYTFDGTPTQIMNNILVGTDFTLASIDFMDVITFAVYEKTNKMDLIIQLANHLGGELDFHNFEISIKNSIGANNGFEIRFGKNLQGIKKIVDRRDNKVSYSVDLLALKNSKTYSDNDLSSLEIIEEGDTVRIIDEVIGIDIVNRIIKRTYNPLYEKNVDLEIANSIDLLTDKVTQIQRDTLIKGKTYYGARISPDSGFESIRNDKFARTVMNADEFAMQLGDGTGDNWTNILYFDPETKEFVFDGKVTTDVTISNTTITNVLYANDGNVARLTVDHVLTGSAFSGDAEINYIDIKDQYIKFITATRLDDLVTYPKQQYTTEEGTLLYWVNNPENALEANNTITTTATPFPVMVFQYELTVKQEFNFEDVDGVKVPKILLGAGDGDTPMSGKAEIFKNIDGLYLNYYKRNTGELVQIALTDEGLKGASSSLEQLSDLNFYTNGFQATYKTETVGYRWVKDGTGKITQLTNVYTGQVVLVDWNGGTM